MKSGLYIALLLNVLMVAASIDSIPDPPALTAHTIGGKTSCQRECAGGFREQHLTCHLDSIPLQVPLPGVSLADATRPKYSADWIVVEVYAADPSPPVL